LLLDESHWRPWGHLLHLVRTGETAFHRAHGAGLFDYLAEHPEVASVFKLSTRREPLAWRGCDAMEQSPLATQACWPVSTRPRLAGLEVSGNVAVDGKDRERLEQLCR
jgi:hypothetical protein